MTHLSRWFLVIFVLQSFHQAAFSQKYLDDLGDAIEPQVQALYEGRYELRLIMFVDSSLTERSQFPSGPILDPNGSLHECSIFTATSKERAFVGVFKKGHILWHSDTLINVDNSYRHSIIATMDLNNDRKVEIITSWSYGMDNGKQGLWIFSWDGEGGLPINDYDSENFSTVVADAGIFKLVDVNADGIYEIQGITNAGMSNENIITYSWNGQKYGNWPGGPHPPTKGYLPKNKVDVDVKSEIKKKTNSGMCTYHYSLENKSTSLQAVELLLLDGYTDTIEATVTPNGWYFCPPRRHLFGWSDDASDPQPIGKNNTETRFEYEAAGLPTLVSYYVQGRNSWYGEPGIDTVTLQFPDEAWYEDVVNNSNLGTSIGPSDVPKPFICPDFLDALVNYTTRSRSLGWFKHQGTSDKYVSYFSSGKSDFEQNKISSLRLTLNQVLSDVNVDSTNNLTSEAYALIRYNTEYLLSQLPASSPRTR